MHFYCGQVVAWLGLSFILLIYFISSHSLTDPKGKVRTEKDLKNILLKDFNGRKEYIKETHPKKYITLHEYKYYKQ